jgi:hypothetical protein
MKVKRRKIPEPDQSMSLQSISPRFILILSTQLRLGLPCGLFLSGFPTINLNSFISSPFVLHARQSHPLSLNHSKYTWRKYKPRSSSCHFIPLRPKYAPQHPVLNTLSPRSSLNVREEISHPYKTTSKIKVLYILMFKFFYSRRKDRRFWTEW